MSFTGKDVLFKEDIFASQKRVTSLFHQINKSIAL
jgi:hypothetical protein